jgi:hypothetical protein
MTSAILTTELIAPAGPRSVAPPELAARLHDIHRLWIDETSDWLHPTRAPDADFWNGWSTVRYLNDQFDRQYRRELALVAAMLPLLRPRDAFILCATTAVLERTRRHIDQVGRRQGMTEVMASLVHRFLELLRTWFTDIERAAEQLTVYELPSAGRRALAQLDAAPATWN